MMLVYSYQRMAAPGGRRAHSTGPAELGAAGLTRHLTPLKEH